MASHLKTHVGELRSLVAVSKVSQKIGEKKKNQKKTLQDPQVLSPKKSPSTVPHPAHQMSSWCLFSQHGTLVNDAMCPQASYGWTSERYHWQHVIFGKKLPFLVNILILGHQQSD